MNDETIIAATRVWLEKAVIGLNLCPFAKSVYVKDQVRIVVSHAPHVDAFLEELDAELEHLSATDPETTDTTLLIHPTLFPAFLDFNDFLQFAEAAPADLGLEGEIQVASFHPDFQFADTAPDDPGNLTNRAPYPTLHLIREQSIARAVASFPDPAAIFERNIETVNRLGPEGWAALGIPYPSKG
ncbi:DUF1415 domain-containing protein [Gulbenkiania mobilis]|uniref:Peptidase n=1 Tax=Gulbenkiania mobilis TaxID=397457 RepID=A0ABY2CXG8_GULMO|nr:DUF1415 domain-containing protein [Gulbenkiania mobilis]TCW32167.1 hypothetical protein EV669_10381 [Gulbenkiania mobilis]